MWETPWDGKQLHGACEGGLSREADLFHDIGHWLVASPDRRHLIGFGLGPSYDGAGGDQKDDPLFKAYVLVEPEVQASAVGILLHAQQDPTQAGFHADEHGWFDPGDRWTDLRESIRKEIPERVLVLLESAGVEIDWSCIDFRKSTPPQ